MFPKKCMICCLLTKKCRLLQQRWQTAHEISANFYNSQLQKRFNIQITNIRGENKSYQKLYINPHSLTYTHQDAGITYKMYLEANQFHRWKPFCVMYKINHVILHPDNEGSGPYSFLAHQIRLSEILPWNRKSYLTHAFLPRASSNVII